MSGFELSLLRKHLNRLDDPEVETLCLDYFPEVYDKVGRGQRHDEKLNLLLDHCRRNPSAMKRLYELLKLEPEVSVGPLHNLPQVDYTAFVGREAELAWLRECLSSEDPVWQVAITGIGGVGKTALVLAMAHEYRVRYAELPAEERFEAIVWGSAKEVVLTEGGYEPAELPSFTLRSLEDIYRMIGRVLEREDIVNADPEEQGWLVNKALRGQRTLLILDNLESFKDERVKSFLRRLPAPMTKAVITSRVWVNVAELRTLTGLSGEEADCLISQETESRQVNLDAGQRRRIFELTSGLPLPIRLAVGRMAGGESFAAMIRWLGDASGDLPEYCVKGQVDWVREREPRAWAALLACALFERDAGGSREAMGKIADLSRVDLDQALTLLQRFFLVGCTEEHFWALPIVQRYMRAQVEQTEVGRQISARKVVWERGNTIESEPAVEPVMTKPEVERKLEVDCRTVPAVEAVVQPDDLTLIEGIGPRIDALLKQHGILTFAQLGTVDQAYLLEFLKASGHRLSMIAPETWPEQARLAAAGNWDELKRLQNKSRNGRWQG